MRITPVNNYSNPQNRTGLKATNNTPSFQGGKIKMIKGIFKSIRSNDKEVFYNDIVNFLDISHEDLAYYTKPQKKYKYGFLYDLASKFNYDKSHMTRKQQEETFNILNKIYNKVDNPQYVHHRLISSSHYSFSDINQILKLSENKKNKLKLINNLLDFRVGKKRNEKIPANVIMHFLTSPSADKISKNFDKYAPFIELNKNKPNLAEMLEAEIKKGYKEEFFTNKLAVNEALRHNSLFVNMNKSELIKNFDEDKYRILDHIDELYATATPEQTQELINQTDTFWNLYNTTNSKNLEIREGLLKYAKKHTTFDKRYEDASLKDIQNLFTKIDTNKKVKKYIQTALKEHYNIISIKELNNLIENNDIDLLNKYAEEIHFINSRYFRDLDYSEENLKKIAKNESKKESKHFYRVTTPRFHRGNSSIYKAYETSKMTKGSVLYNQEQAHKSNFVTKFLNGITNIFSK